MWVTRLILFTLSGFALYGQDGTRLWEELNTKRDSLPGFEQRFDVLKSFQTAGDDPRQIKSEVLLQVSEDRWRETKSLGSGDTDFVFDGKDVFEINPSRNEYVRTKSKGREEGHQPEMYATTELDLRKAREAGRWPCGFKGQEHPCVVIDIPAKPGFSTAYATIAEGTTRFMVDEQTGLVISARSIRLINQRQPSYQYKIDVTYRLKTVKIGKPEGTGLFEAPDSSFKEVSSLSRWTASEIKKELQGKAAPDFQLVDLKGNKINLAANKGKIVLLDFWATWCGPCREDGPSLDKLHTKYGEKDLLIVGISVSEDRPVVEEFLKKKPHSYPIVLSTENQLPKAYQIGVFPTYVVIDRDGTLLAVTEGTQGFGSLRKLLRKAGIEEPE